MTNLVSTALIGTAFGIAIYLHEDAEKKREKAMRKVAFIQQKAKPPEPPKPKPKPPPPPPKKKPGPKGPDKPKKQRLKAPDREVAKTLKAPEKIPDKADKPPETVDVDSTHMSTEGTDDESMGALDGTAEPPPEGPTGTGGGGEGAPPAPPPPPPPPPPKKPKPIFLRAGMPEPERIEGDNPSMPTAAVQAGIEGQVVLLIHVGTTGRVTKVQVIKKLPILAEHCARIVRTWRYKPYIHNGQAVPFIVRQPFVFKLSQ